MFLYCLFIVGTMTGSSHHANDDCAICRAWTKKQAMRKFSKLYRCFTASDVSRVRFAKGYGVAVLSDY